MVCKQCSLTGETKDTGNESAEDHSIEKRCLNRSEAETDSIRRLDDSSSTFINTHFSWQNP